MPSLVVMSFIEDGIMYHVLDSEEVVTLNDKGLYVPSHHEVTISINSRHEAHTVHLMSHDNFLIWRV